MAEIGIVLLWICIIIIACFWEERTKKRKPANNFYNRSCDLYGERCSDCPYEYWIVGNGVSKTSTDHILSCGRAKTMMEKCKGAV